MASQQDILRAENEQLRRDLERQKEQCFELEEQRQRIQTETKAQVDSVNFHKALLANEVVKLRDEIAQLKAGAAETGNRPEGGYSSSDGEYENQIRNLKAALEHLEAEKAEAMKTASSHKAILAKEVKNLRSDVAKLKTKNEQLEEQLAAAGGGEAYGARGDGGDGVAQSKDDMLGAYETKQRLELIFVKQIVDLRQMLKETALKNVAGESPLGVRDLLQLSNNRIDKVLEEIARVGVTPGERLQQETQSLLLENARLRKQLNDYAEGLLDATMKKMDAFDRTGSIPPQPQAERMSAKQPAYGGSNARVCAPERMFLW